jgi:hypothetical protein
MSTRIRSYSVGSRSKERTAQNIKERPAKNTRAARARERISLSGHAINGFVRLVLCGIPYRGLRVATKRFHLYPNEPASHFPQRAGSTATGRLHCCLCNFSRITHMTLVRNPAGQTSPVRNCDSLTITTPQQKHKPTSLWKPRHFCGKGLFAAVSGNALTAKTRKWPNGLGLPVSKAYRWAMPPKGGRISTSSC